MYLMGQFIVDSYPDELEADLDFFRFPIIDPSVPIGEDAPTDGYFMAANARNLDGGKDSWPSSARWRCSRRRLTRWAACPPALMSM